MGSTSSSTQHSRISPMRWANPYLLSPRPFSRDPFKTELPAKLNAPSMVAAAPQQTALIRQVRLALPPKGSLPPILGCFPSGAQPGPLTSPAHAPVPGQGALVCGPTRGGARARGAAGVHRPRAVLQPARLRGQLDDGAPNPSLTRPTAVQHGPHGPHGPHAQYAQ